MDVDHSLTEILMYATSNNLTVNNLSGSEVSIIMLFYKWLVIVYTDG